MKGAVEPSREAIRHLHRQTVYYRSRMREVVLKRENRANLTTTGKIIGVVKKVLPIIALGGGNTQISISIQTKVGLNLGIGNSETLSSHRRSSFAEIQAQQGSLQVRTLKTISLCYPFVRHLKSLMQYRC